jgi:hypothetical protein
VAVGRSIVDEYSTLPTGRKAMRLLLMSLLLVMRWIEGLVGVKEATLVSERRRGGRAI